MKKRFSKLAFITIMLFSIICLAGCQSSSKNKDTNSSVEGKPVIAVSIVPEETFVKAVCGDLAAVVTLIPPGNSPENYEPSPETMEKLSDSSVYFSIGVPAEEVTILPSIGNVKVVSLNEETKKVYEERTFDSGKRDPHIWLSPKRVKIMIDVIAKEMAILDEEHSAQYQKNAEEYKKELDKLDYEIKDALNGIKIRKFITYHPAFGYIADDYNLMMYALEKDGKEATTKTFQKTIDLAKKENIKVVFCQEEIDSRQSKAFAEEIGGEIIQLSPLSADYIINMKHMAQTMKEAMH